MGKNHNDKLQPLVLAKTCSPQLDNPRRRKNGSEKFPSRYGIARQRSLMLTRLEWMGKR